MRDPSQAQRPQFDAVYQVLTGMTPVDELSGREKWEWRWHTAKAYAGWYRLRRWLNYHLGDRP